MGDTFTAIFFVGVLPLLFLMLPTIFNLEEKKEEESKKKLTEEKRLPNTLKTFSENNQKLNFNKPIEPHEQFEDKELAGLRLELKSLTSKFQELIVQKIEYLDDIDELNREYNLRLGEIIKSILNFKKKILYKQTIKYQELTTEKEFIKNDRIFQEYEDAKTDYDKFDESYAHFKESQKEKINLNEQDRAQLKQLYREAVKLCHTNIVTDEQKQQVIEIMQLLKAAYNKQDLDLIKELFRNSTILNSTILSVLYLHSTFSDKARLIKKIKELKENIANIESEIDAILQDETYQTIAAIEDWDKYFDELKRQLTEEKERLEAENRAISEVSDEANRRYQGFDTEKISNKIDQVVPVIQKENSHYAKHIQSIQVPNFERIRRYCNNLVDENKADEMQKYLAENGKMHKALIYDALEQFIKDLEGQSVTLIDWGCGQGIASMLVLDYIREKQLDIKVSQVILIDDDIKALSRAMAQAEALKQEDLIIEAIDKVQGDIIDGNTPKIHLFVNDKIQTDLSNIDFEDSYVLCLSHQTTKTIDSVSQIVHGREISKRDGNIGRFKRFERIFKLDCINKKLTCKNGISSIDLDEMPF